MKTVKPLESVGWLGGSSNRLVINERAREEAEKTGNMLREGMERAEAERNTWPPWMRGSS